jgi:enoyl-CoA hydratase/carnithine racemase
VFTRLEDYKNKFPNIRFERRNAILQITFHTNGGPFVWSALPDGPQHTAGEAFHDVAHDPENRVVIITSVGDQWCVEYDATRLPDQAGVTPLWWDYLFRAERDLLQNLLNIPVPVIGVMNGPATYHAEILLLSDVLFAAEDAYIADDSHIYAGVVPGDGIQTVWDILVGPNRTRAMQYLHQKIPAKQALDLGIVAEVHPREALLPRAWEVAEDLIARCSPVTLRNSRSTMTDNIRRRLAAEHLGSYALEGLAQVMRPQLTQMAGVEVWPKGDPRAGSIKIGHD